ncbi:MAG: AraC family transcriptional regulator [Myxococcota bacterium]
MNDALTAFSEYLLELEDDALHEVEVRSVRARELDIVKVSQTGPRNDPASDDYIMAMPLKVLPRGGFDFGAGRFEDTAGYGSALIEPPGVACLYDLPEDAQIEALAVSLSADRVRGILDQLPGGAHVDFAELHSGVLRSVAFVQLVENLWQEVAAGEPNRRLHGDGAVLSLVGMMMRLSGAPPSKGSSTPASDDPRFLRAMDYIEANLAEDLRIAKIGAAVGMSESSVARMFRKALRCTVLQHVQRRRIARAAELLRTSGMSVLEIATSVGYDNPQYFATLFRGLMGTSPTAYRRGFRS